MTSSHFGLPQAAAQICESFFDMRGASFGRAPVDMTAPVASEQGSEPQLIALQGPSWRSHQSLEPVNHDPNSINGLFSTCRFADLRHRKSFNKCGDAERGEGRFSFALSEIADLRNASLPGDPR